MKTLAWSLVAAVVGYGAVYAFVTYFPALPSWL